MRHAAVHLCMGVLGLLPMLGTAAPQWQGAAEVSLIHDDNLNNAPSSAPSRTDSALLANVRRSARWRLGQRNDLSLRGEAETVQWRSYDALRHWHFALGARYRHLLSQGFSIPHAVLDVSLFQTANEGELRDHSGLQIMTGITGELSTRLSGRAFADYRATRGPEAVQDTRRWGLRGDIDWLVSPTWVAYLGVGWHRGDTLTTGSLPANVLAASAANASDSAFAPGETRARLKAITREALLGLNWRLTPNLALDLLLRHVNTRTEVGSRYRRRQVVLGALWNF